MTTEKLLYALVVILIQKDLKFIAENKSKYEDKFKVQGQSATSKHWLDLDFDWIEVKFSIREPDFYKILLDT